MENELPEPVTSLPKLTKKYETNPFFDGLKVRGRIKTRVMTPMTSDKFMGVIEGDNPNDTELAAIQRFKVDEDKFVKVYTRFFAAWFDMTKTAQRIFQAVMMAIQRHPNEDCFWLSIRDVEEFCGLKAKATINEGLRELVALKIIAPSARGAGWWFYNPQYIFNGDRMTFYTQIVKVKKQKDDPNQLTFLSDSGRIVSPDLS